jgi:hypothetical protein
MDPLTFILRTFADAIAGLPDPAALLILRALIFFGVTTGTTAWTFHLGSRLQSVQILAATVGFLLATYFPVTWILHAPPAFKASVLILSLAALAFLPGMLPRYLTPNRRMQANIREWSYVTLGGFFLAALI